MDVNNASKLRTLPNNIRSDLFSPVWIRLSVGTDIIRSHYLLESLRIIDQSPVQAGGMPLFALETSRPRQARCPCSYFACDEMRNIKLKVLQFNTYVLGSNMLRRTKHGEGPSDAALELLPPNISLTFCPISASPPPSLAGAVFCLPPGLI